MFLEGKEGGGDIGPPIFFKFDLNFWNILVYSTGEISSVNFIC